jgi:hypothetical protein
MTWNRKIALWLGAGIGVVLLTASCSVLKLVSGTSDRLSYYPLAVGDEWEYRLVTTFGRGPRLDTTTLATYHHRITGTVKLASGEPMLLHVWNSQVTLRDTALPESSFSQAETTYYRRSRNAVYRYLTREDKPDSILLLPLEMDRRWESNGIRYWVSGREDVTVDGNTYPGCWRIQTTPADDANPLNVWFGRGLGLVRMVNERDFSGHKMRTDYYLVRATIRD